MGRFRSGSRFWAVAVLSIWGFSACGGGGKAGPPLFAGRINLSPNANISMVLGGSINFTASAQTASGTNLSVPITFSSSDTSILNIASNGVACAGHWDATFSTCTPGGTGVVQVTATALEATSIPTYVFVHPAIDNITVTGVLLDGVPVQEPCLSQTQSMTLEAHAFSQGTDVTASVGPFTWSANDSAVVNLVPLVNNAYKFATNQVTATAAAPGITRIVASASGVTSSSFQQPTYQLNGTNSPVLDFFATCPIQNISLEVGTAGSRQTSFATTKSTGAPSETIVATVTDVMGNTSLPNTNGGIVLSKVPLTWASSQPGVIGIGTGCTQSCVLTLSSPGAASVTASCSPPSCNVGFPQVPQSLSSTAQLTACTDFFHAEFPQFLDCRLMIPMPVYSSPVFIVPPTPPNTPTQLAPDAAISAVVAGTPVAASVLAASTDCAHQPPADCSTSLYYLSTAKQSVGNESPLPNPPNSFLFDLAGDKILMGSDFGAQIINPASFGSSSNPYTSLGSITGKILATTHSGSISVFSDTVHSPNQVYIVNGNAGSVSASALNIPAATFAEFSPDGLKGYILGGTTGTSLYVYSPLQALQGPIALTAPGNAVAFAPNGAFAFVAESNADGSGANLSAYSTCNNQPAATLSLPAFSLSTPRLPNLLMRVLPNVHIDGVDSSGIPFPDGIHIAVLDSTGIDIINASIAPAAAGTLCPQLLQFDPTHPIQRIEWGHGTLTPVNFFASPDGTQFYLVDSNSSSILVYNTLLGAVTGGIELAGGATPLSADMSSDGSVISVAGSDGMFHQITTQIGGNDQVQLSFPNLPNFFDAFCSFTPAAGPCILNTVAVRP